MALNKKQINTIIIFILLLILAYFIYKQYSNYNKNNNGGKKNNDNKNNLDTFLNTEFSKICTMTLNDVDQRNLDEYNSFNNREIKCGDKCSDGILKMDITTCATDENGVSLSNCFPSANINKITTVNQLEYIENVIFPKKVTAENIKKFFCFE
jgi:hypothetical protein